MPTEFISNFMACSGPPRQHLDVSGCPGFGVTFGTRCQGPQSRGKDMLCAKLVAPISRQKLQGPKGLEHNLDLPVILAK